MTIKKGQDWGEAVDRPADLQIVATDTELARALSADPIAPVALSGGDMFRTIGARPVADRTELIRYPIDLFEVELDDGVLRPAVAHLLLRLPRSRGGAFRGPVLAVMNAEYIGEFDVAPRGHPNDGRVETLLVDAAMPARQRLKVRRRLRNASHLPHPQIANRPVRSADWTFAAPMVAIVDGVAVGRTKHASIRVQPDAATLFG